MPIRPADDPASARAVASTAFSPRPAGGGAIVRGIMQSIMAEAPQVGTVALFNLRLESLIKGRFDDAVATGWRYVRLYPGAETGEVVEVREGGDEPAEFANFATGRLAGRMSEAGGAAADLLADAPDDYEARVLRLPEIHMEALWLHSRDENVQDRFFGLPSTQKDLVDEAFVAAAVERARIYLSQGRDRPAGAPLGAGT